MDEFKYKIMLVVLDTKIIFSVDDPIDVDVWFCFLLIFYHFVFLDNYVYKYIL